VAAQLRGKATPMSKPYDVTTKDLLRRDPASWMAYFRLNVVGPIQAIATDVSTVPAETDQVYRVGGRAPHLVHIEMQSRRHSKLARRLWRYNALLDLKYNLRVRSIAVLLRPEADSRKLIGVLDLRLPDGDRVVTFYYRVIRAWEQPVEPLLTGALATLPMAPLADVPLDDLPRVLDRIDSRLTEEAPAPDAARIMTSALTLAGMRLDPDEIKALGKRLRTMNILKDSSFYQVILKEGMEKGRKEGLGQGQRQGRIEGARDVLFRQGRIRFGRLDKSTRGAIGAIDDLDRLEQLSERLLTATSWAELLAESE
jgi:predicted transposase/invertase (TIGR01784 family)